MATIAKTMMIDVVKPANLAETMASGVVAGIVTPLMQSVIPASIPFSPYVADGVQVIAGAALGKTIGGTAGTIIQNGCVIGAATDLGNALFAKVKGMISPAQSTTNALATSTGNLY